jgi:threonine/homoserine/homoserine lactone efflux protein
MAPMLTSALLIAFLSAAVPAFFTPGPNNLMLMASSAKFGFARTVPHMVGVILGFPLMVALIGLGLGEVFAALPWLEPVLKYLAAAYLLWMAWTLVGLRIKHAEGGKRPMRLHEAALFQWINPKGWAMAVSFVALLVPAGEGHFGRIALLTLGCLVLAPFSSLTWMVFGNRLETWLRRTGNERHLGPVLAALMVLAVVLFLI